MRPTRVFIAALLLLGASTAAPAQLAQIIIIPAGTPEDGALQQVNQEPDPQKKAQMLEEFVQQFSSNAAAVAYGQSQLAELALARGDAQDALAHGDKALEAMPNNLDLIMAQVTAALQIKDNARLVEYALRGGELYNTIGKQKPEGMTDEEFRPRVEEQRAQYKSSYEYLESVAFNGIAGEEKPSERMALIERFTPAFPESKFEEQVAQFAMIALQQMNDRQRLVSYAEKTLAANPESVPVLVLLADTFGSDPKTAARGVEYGRKATELADKEAASDPQRALLAATAHTTLGKALLNQGNSRAAIAELQEASGALKNEPGVLAECLYYLGFAYAKLNRLTEARQVLMQAVEINSPYRQPARDLLVKVNAARSRTR
ncbi:MAG TPA: tetratricopeptide repeat protein [Terriglobales bacterium]|nr:tetratricopeptide repeat protein [Terriglobales bacterium]